MMYKTHQMTTYTLVGAITYMNYKISTDISKIGLIDSIIYDTNAWIAEHIFNIHWLKQYQLLPHWQGKLFIFSLLLTAAIGALIPDIDHPNSKLGKHMPSWFSRLIGHRTYTHSLLLYSPLMIGIYFLFDANYATTYINMLLLGACMHIIEDYFSIESIHLFYPIHKNKRTRYSKFRYRTNGLSEKIIFGIMSFGAVIITIAWLSDIEIIQLAGKNITQLIQ